MRRRVLLTLDRVLQVTPGASRIRPLRRLATWVRVELAMGRPVLVHRGVVALNPEQCRRLGLTADVPEEIG